MEVKINDSILLNNGFKKSTTKLGDDLFTLNYRGKKIEIIKTKDGQFHTPNIGPSFKVENLSQINDAYNHVTGKKINENEP